MKFKLWLEATNNYVEKKVDPALLTFPEFWEMVNPCEKTHPETAYNYPVSRFNGDKSKYPILINTITSKGIRFEIRLRKDDLYEGGVYAKKDPSGEFVRDENNKIIYYTREELLKLSKFRRYEYSFAIFHDNQKVAAAQDEWGTILVMVAQEYRSFGLGSILTKLAWEAEPGKDTGGCTPAGQSLTKSVYASFVREYLQKGFYSFLVKQGKLTSERAKKIISSAGLTTKGKQKSSIDLNADDPSNWLLFGQDGTFILYDKKFKDMYQEEDQFWPDKCIKGIGDVGPHTDGSYKENSSYRLRAFGGDSDVIKRWLMYLVVSWTGEEDGKPLYVYGEDLKYVDTKLMKIDPYEKNGWVSLIAEPADYKGLLRVEKSWRKSFDKYNEFYYVLIERAVSKYQD